MERYICGGTMIIAEWLVLAIPWLLGICGCLIVFLITSKLWIAWQDCIETVSECFDSEIMDEYGNYVHTEVEDDEND